MYFFLAGLVSMMISIPCFFNDHPYWGIAFVVLGILLWAIRIAAAGGADFGAISDIIDDFGGFDE